MKGGVLSVATIQRNGAVYRFTSTKVIEVSDVLRAFEK